MDATRTRRTRDQARQGWYARHRQWRFARYLGFPAGPEIAITATISVQLSAKSGRRSARVRTLHPSARVP